MNANIFRHEFGLRLRSALVWGASIAALLFIFFAMFPVFADQAALMNEFLARYPAELRIALGLSNMDLSTVLGFFSFIFLFVQLCVAVQAANYGVGLVSVEETELTADFLLTKPVSRTQVMTSKLLAAFAALSITTAMTWAFTFLAITLFGEGREYSVSTLLLVLVSIIIFQLSFLSLGLFVSLLVKRVRSVTPYALGLAFGAYVLSAFNGVMGEVGLDLITPFKHLDAAYIIHNGAYNGPLLALNVAVTLVAIAASFWRYLRRDIHAVS